jgi:hypothetical protein
LSAGPYLYGYFDVLSWLESSAKQPPLRPWPCPPPWHKGIGYTHEPLGWLPHAVLGGGPEDTSGSWPRSCEVASRCTRQSIYAPLGMIGPRAE